MHTQWVVVLGLEALVITNALSTSREQQCSTVASLTAPP
jgi:hypothetical protein